MKFLRICLTLGIAALAALDCADVRGQGASTNNYLGTGPTGPYTLSSEPTGIGGALQNYPLTYENVSLGTNALGVVTNQVMPATTNMFAPSNTVFNCSDYSVIGFQLTMNISNAPAAGQAYTHLWRLAFSNDGTNYDTIVDPLNIGCNISLTNAAGQFIMSTNISCAGHKTVYIVQAGAPTPLAGTNAYATNIIAEFSGSVPRTHVNVGQN